MSNTTAQEIQATLKRDKKSRNAWKYVILLILLIIIGFVWWMSSQEGTQTIRYQTVHPERKDLISTVSATGNLEPTNSIDIGIEVSGTLAEVLVNYNDHVTKGQILAKLDTTKLQAQRNNAQASLEVAQATLEESRISRSDAKIELNRIEKLYRSTGGNYPARKELDAARILYQKAQAAYKAAAAKVEQSKATLKTYEDDLSKAIVVSPIDGIVLNKAVEVGQSVVATMTIPTLFTLAQDLKAMQVILSVDEADVGEVKAGQAVHFTVDAYPAKTFDGLIQQVRMNSQIVNNVVTYETVVSVDNREQLLRPGMTVSADITTSVVPYALIVPNSALRFVPSVKSEPSTRKFILFGPRDRRPKTDLSMSGKQLWILKAKQPVAIPVTFGESDGVNTVVNSDQITTESQVIIGIQESKE